LFYRFSKCRRSRTSCSANNSFWRT
jgi:hypothetical protein